MKALQYKQFGGLEVLALNEVPEPHTRAREVRIRVTAVGLNPMDWLIMSNEQIAQSFGVKLPQIFAYDFAGVIDEVGAEVTDYKIGERVFGTTYNGAAAEYILISTDLGERNRIVHTPEQISDETAAGLGVAGWTAAVALRKANVTAGDKLLIAGAAGGVGVLAVQLAQLAGAKVIGTASNRTADFLRSLGAEQVAYGEGLIERVRDKNITAVIDLFSHETLEVGLALGVSPRKMSTIIMFPEPPAHIARATGGEGTDEDMAKILAALVDGKLTLPIAASYPLSDYQKAIDFQRSRHANGKVVISF